MRPCTAGITGVKVDCQAGVGLIGSKRGGGPVVARNFHTALEESIRTHFPGNHAINCMAHSTENIYRCDRSSACAAPCIIVESSSCRRVGGRPRCPSWWSTGW